MNKNVEIERKWLVKKNELPDSYKKHKHHKIEQAYLLKDPSIRIRKSNNNFTLTVKCNSLSNGLVRDEYEININKSQYTSLLKKCDNHIINKTRYYIPFKGYKIELDIFDKPYENLVYAEVEFKNIIEAEKFVKPKWLGKEVTKYSKYSNTYLAFNI